MKYIRKLVLSILVISSFTLEANQEDFQLINKWGDDSQRPNRALTITERSGGVVYFDGNLGVNNSGKAGIYFTLTRHQLDACALEDDGFMPMKDNVTGFRETVYIVESQKIKMWEYCNLTREGSRYLLATPKTEDGLKFIINKFKTKEVSEGVVHVVSPWVDGIDLSTFGFSNSWSSVNLDVAL